MSLEIELKAWVDDVDALRAVLEREAKFLYHYKKDDLYWFAKDKGSNRVNNLPFSGLRVRREARTFKDEKLNEEIILVTYKTKEKRQGIEVNTEEEFEVAGGISSFEGLIERLGLERGYTKQKRGSLYRAGKINAELSRVEKLGTFIELEILSGDDDSVCEESAHYVNSVHTELFDFLSRLGISKDKIETRYYSELLQQLAATNC